jgi:hypothetical protein
MSRLLLRNVFLRGIGVVAVSASARALGSSPAAKTAQTGIRPSFTSGREQRLAQGSALNRPDGSRRHA